MKLSVAIATILVFALKGAVEADCTFDNGETVPAKTVSQLGGSIPTCEGRGDCTGKVKGEPKGDITCDPGDAGDILYCEGGSSCKGLEITPGCSDSGRVICGSIEVTGACQNAIINGDLECFGTPVMCIGSKACSKATIVTGLSVNCEGPLACDGASLDVGNSIICKGGSGNKEACTGSTIIPNNSETTTVLCYGNGGCSDDFITNAQAAVGEVFFF